MNTGSLPKGGVDFLAHLCDARINFVLLRHRKPPPDALVHLVRVPLPHQCSVRRLSILRPRRSPHVHTEKPWVRQRRRSCTIPSFPLAPAGRPPRHPLSNRQLFLLRCRAVWALWWAVWARWWGVGILLPAGAPWAWWLLLRILLLLLSPALPLIFTVLLFTLVFGSGTLLLLFPLNTPGLLVRKLCLPSSTCGCNVSLFGCLLGSLSGQTLGAGRLSGLGVGVGVVGFGSQCFRTPPVRGERLAWAGGLLVRYAARGPWLQLVRGGRSRASWAPPVSGERSSRAVSRPVPGAAAEPRTQAMAFAVLLVFVGCVESRAAREAPLGRGAFLVV